MRILILGGDGYLGWATAMYFSARGHEVHTVDSYLRRLAHWEAGTDSLTPDGGPTPSGISCRVLRMVLSFNPLRFFMRLSTALLAIGVGRAPFYERGLDDLLSERIEAGRPAFLPHRAAT
jgi:nucleoside-diphosphate-sugar epimerase